jgi:hypothetical protein
MLDGANIFRSSPKADFVSLYQPQPLEAGVTVLADADVVAHGDGEWARRLDDPRESFS